MRLDRWRAQLEALPRNAPVPRRLVEQCLVIARDLAGDDGADGVLVHGDPHFGPAPMLQDRWDEGVASGEVLNAVWELAERDPDPAWITRSVTIAKAVQQ